MYLSEDDLELDDAVETASQAPKPNAFEVMMGKAYKEKELRRGSDMLEKEKIECCMFQ
jgi:hypothetical protein